MPGNYIEKKTDLTPLFSPLRSNFLSLSVSLCVSVVIKVVHSCMNVIYIPVCLGTLCVIVYYTYLCVCPFLLFSPCLTYCQCQGCEGKQWSYCTLSAQCVQKE